MIKVVLLYALLLLVSINRVLAFSNVKTSTKYNFKNNKLLLQMAASDSSLRIRRMKEIIVENEDSLRSIDAVKIIKVCFEDFTDVRRVLPLSRLADIIFKCDLNLDVHQLTDAVSGLQDLPSDEEEVRELLNTLIVRLEACDDNDWRASDITNCLSGLQSMTCQHEEVRNLITLCTNKLSMPTLQLGVLDVANCIYGLQSISSDTIEVRELLCALTDKLAGTMEPISSKSLNLFGYGMQKMKSDNRAVLDFLRVLTRKLRKSDTSLSGQALVNSLFLCKSMTSENPEVLAWIDLIASRMDASKRNLKSYMIARAMSGIQGLRSDRPQVRRLCSALSKKTLKCVVDVDDEMSAADMSKCFLGFKHMNSEEPEVRRLLGAMVFKSMLSKKPITAKAVGLSLVGLQTMNRSANEVQYTLGMLEKKVQRSNKLDFQERGMALYGIHGKLHLNPETVFETLHVDIHRSVH